MPHQDYIGSDGKPWPSATELTRLLPQDWLWAWYKREVEKAGYEGWLKCKATSELGMEIGTEVHGLLEGFIKKEKFEVSGNHNSQELADALFDKVNPLVEDYIALEPHLVSEKLRLHGTADVIVRLVNGDGVAVLDWKTSYEKSNTHPIQLAIYARMYNEQNNGIQIDKGIIARVDKKSAKLNVKLDEYTNLKQYYPVIEALRTIWEYQND